MLEAENFDVKFAFAVVFQFFNGGIFSLSRIIYLNMITAA